MRQGKGLSAPSRKRMKARTRSAGQPADVCGATTQNCWASAGSARPKCSSTGGVPVAPSEMMSHRRLPDSPAPCRYSSKGSGSAACGGVYTSAAKVFGSRISVRGELVEEAKRRGADSEAASAISASLRCRWSASRSRRAFPASALLAQRGDNRPNGATYINNDPLTRRMPSKVRTLLPSYGILQRRGRANHARL